MLSKRDSIQTLSFQYELTASYAAPIRRHNFAFSFLPIDTVRQQVLSLNISVPGCYNLRETVGQFGSKRVYGSLDEPHTVFSVAVSGQVKAGLEIYEEHCDDPLKTGFSGCSPA